MKTMICFENISYSSFNNEVIEDINAHTENSNEEISIVSFDETMPFRDINTAIYKPTELDSFNNGIIICPTIELAKNALKTANNSKRILYLYDLEWMFRPMLYEEVYELISDENLFLILRSEDHKSPVKNISNREPDAIINKFSLEKIWNLL